MGWFRPPHHMFDTSGLVDRCLIRVCFFHSITTHSLGEEEQEKLLAQK